MIIGTVHTWYEHLSRVKKKKTLLENVMRISVKLYSCPKFHYFFLPRRSYKSFHLKMCSPEKMEYTMIEITQQDSQTFALIKHSHC